MSKRDVMEFVRASFDKVIEKVSRLTPAMLSKSYSSDEGITSGLDY